MDCVLFKRRVLVYSIRFLLFLPCLTAFVAISAPAAPNADQNTYIRHVRTGSEKLKSGDYAAARDSFLEALRFQDGDVAAHLGLGLAYFHLRDYHAAERSLSQAVQLEPASSPAYQWLGELYYRKDDLETAVSYWEKAVDLNPSDNALKARLERIRKEHTAEKDFNRDATGHFLIKYEGREKIEAGRIILRILEDAYGEVGRGLSYYPDSEMQVILYSARQFQEVTDAPGWSSGLYDGKIRIPIGGIEKETPGLRRLLYHEYTHAVIRAITKRCPTWLNEGLAQHFEGREIDDHQRLMLRKAAQAGKLTALSSLEGSFTGLDSNQALYAYLVSLSAVGHMIDTFGLYRVQTILEELAAGADSARAIDRGLLLSAEEFERGWRRSLE